MSCASFIPATNQRVHLAKTSRPHFSSAEEHTALIGLQALTLNLKSANRSSEEILPKKKAVRSLHIPKSRKTPEKHVSISPLPAISRSFSSGGVVARSRPSPSRSVSSGAISLSPTSPSSAGSSCSDVRLFTNYNNFEVKTSESMDSLNTRSSLNGGRGSRQIRPRSRQNSRHSSSQSRQTTPQRQDSSSDVGSPQPEETMSVFEVQNLLRKGEVVEGVLRFDRRSFENAYIRAPIDLDRADGHVKLRNGL